MEDKKYILLYAPLIALYLIQMQVLIPEKIRQELRTELGYLNIFLFPILTIINVVCLVYIIKSNRFTIKNKLFYSLFSLILYIIIVLNIVL